MHLSPTSKLGYLSFKSCIFNFYDQLSTSLMLWSHKIVRNFDSQGILRKVDVLGRCHVAIGAFFRIIGMSVIQFCFQIWHLIVTSRAMFNFASSIFLHSKIGNKKRSNRLNIINFESIIFHNDRCSSFDIIYSP